MKRENPKETKSKVNGGVPESDDLSVQRRIAMRAYELYLHRGGVDGRLAAVGGAAHARRVGDVALDDLHTELAQPAGVADAEVELVRGFGLRILRPVVAGEEDDRVVGEFQFVKRLQQPADLRVKVGQ